MNARLVLIPVAAAAIAFAVWKFVPASPADGPTPTPASTWRIGLGAQITQARNYHELAAESPIRLSFTCSEPRYVYVFSHSLEDGTVLMFPSAELKGGLANPLPAGNTVLPGVSADKELAWTTRSGILAVTTMVAIASRERIPELEELIGKVRYWSNCVLTTGDMVVTKAKEGMQVLGPPRSTKFPSPLLQRAAEFAITDDMPNGPMHEDTVLPGVWTTSWKVIEQKKG
ncbi:MAG TPA: hypothetical protein VFD82_23225 [Planctomycetota bacterium]|nr:hypothetical protein [Planctomycetota bacterium]